MRGGKPVAIVTGSNRGLGLETCRQLAESGFDVVGTSREESAMRAALEAVGADDLPITPAPLDVTSGKSIEQLRDRLQTDFGAVDALVNNAGVSLDGFDARVVRDTLAVNLFGAVAVTDELLPLLSDRATVTMVSSGLGEITCLAPARRPQFEDAALTREDLAEIVEGFVRSVEAGTHIAQGWPSSAYRVSKVALNAFTRILAREQRDTGRLINAVCPGWVRTDMGGDGASRSIEEGARGIVWAATLPPGGPSGGFFRDGESIPW